MNFLISTDVSGLNEKQSGVRTVCIGGSEIKPSRVHSSDILNLVRDNCTWSSDRMDLYSLGIHKETIRLTRQSNLRVRSCNKKSSGKGLTTCTVEFPLNAVNDVFDNLDFNDLMFGSFLIQRCTEFYVLSLEPAVLRGESSRLISLKFDKQPPPPNAIKMSADKRQYVANYGAAQFLIEHCLKHRKVGANILIGSFEANGLLSHSNFKGFKNFEHAHRAVNKSNISESTLLPKISIQNAQAMLLALSTAYSCISQRKGLRQFSLSKSAKSERRELAKIRATIINLSSHIRSEIVGVKKK